MRGVLLAVCALVLASCRSHSFSHVWEDPDWDGAPLRNVLVVGMQADAVMRRAYEDALIARLEKIGVATPSRHAARQPDRGAVARAIATGEHVA
jgi:hypothetical protein